MLPSLRPYSGNMLIFTFLTVALYKELLGPLVKGQGQIKTIQT